MNGNANNDEKEVDGLSKCTDDSNECRHRHRPLSQSDEKCAKLETNGHAGHNGLSVSSQDVSRIAQSSHSPVNNMVSSVLDEERSPPMASMRTGLHFAVASGYRESSSCSNSMISLHESNHSSSEAKTNGNVTSCSEIMSDESPSTDMSDHSAHNRPSTLDLGRMQGSDSSRRVASTPHIIAMVGLPARGKTYISKNLCRYLNWIGVQTKVINLGDYRRQCMQYQDHSVFSPTNSDGSRLRSEICQKGLTDAIRYITSEGGEVVVFDATNTTRARRKILYDRIVVENGFKLFFVESICNDSAIVESNIKSVKVTSPDYVGFTEDAVVADFHRRIGHYVDQYETLDERLESHLSFLQIYNAGEKTVVHKHEGHIQSRIVYYLMNCKITPRVIYLTRHGESHFNVAGRIGGDSTLTENGESFATALGQYMKSVQSGQHDRLLVWTSCMRRAVRTAKFVDGIHEKWKALNEIDVGVCDGLTYVEIANRYPADFKSRDENKFSYRYSRGESYGDVVARVEPVIMELERQSAVLVVSHQAVLRCILAYFMDVGEEKLPYLEIPLHTVIRLDPHAYGCRASFHVIDVPCVVTHRPKPVSTTSASNIFSKKCGQNNANSINGTYEDSSSLLYS